jgi:transposase
VLSRCSAEDWPEPDAGRLACPVLRGRRRRNAPLLPDSVHGVDPCGKVVMRRTIGRGKLLTLVAQLPPCVIGLEACSGAHEWARQFRQLGHDARLMAPKFVTPYRKSGKNDGNDAEAICEAVSRPSMRFVPVKSTDQQAVLTLHRVRQGFIEERTATINRIRGLLAEFGVVLPQRASAIVATVSDAREFASARQFAAWLGLVPRQYSTGGKSRLGHITKRGDAYLRTLLILGARSTLRTAAKRADRLARWAISVKQRRGYHRAGVAIAAKKRSRFGWPQAEGNLTGPDFRHETAREELTATGQQLC